MTTGWPRIERSAVEVLLQSERYLQDICASSYSTNAILMYHSVGERGLYGNVSVERFRRDMTFLDEFFEIVDLPAVLDDSPRASDVRSDRSRKVAVSFDDGYENFYTQALPVVRDLDVPVTVFVSPGFLRGRNREFTYRFVRSPSVGKDHNDPTDRRSPSPGTLRLMSDAQLRNVINDDRVTIGNHTRLHPDLSAITNRDDLAADITAAERLLEDHFDITVDRFAYPYGRYNERALDLVRRSHDLAVTTNPGLIRTDTDRYQLPRISAHEPESRLRWHLSDLRRSAIGWGKRALEHRKESGRRS